MLGVATICLAALATMLAAPAADAPAPDNGAAALRAQATTAFKAKSYAEACPLFEKAAALAPKDGDIQADLGLCWDKAGDKAKAQAADLKAVALGDATTRLHAYYNLYKAGRVLAVSKTETDAKGKGEPACVTWDSDAPCAKKLSACPYEETSGGTGGETTDTGTAICDSLEHASGLQVAGDTVDGCFAMVTQSSTQSFCREQDLCRGSDGDVAAGDKCDDAIAACTRDNDKPAPRADCTVVYNDACQLRVGAVCDGKAVELTPGHDFAPADPPVRKVKGGKKKKAHK